MQNQSKHSITFDTQLKTALIPLRLVIMMNTATMMHHRRVSLGGLGSISQNFLGYGQNLLRSVIVFPVPNVFRRLANLMFLRFFLFLNKALDISQSVLVYCIAGSGPYSGGPCS